MGRVCAGDLVWHTALVSSVVVAVHRLMVAVGESGEMSLGLMRLQLMPGTCIGGLAWRGLATRFGRVLLESGTGALAAMRAAAVLVLFQGLFGNSAKLVGMVVV